MVLTKKGAKGEDVKKAQAAINKAMSGTQGYVPLVEDGIFGDKTYTAVKQYQAKNGLTSDGIIGDATRGKLYSVTTPTPKPIATVTTPKPIAPRRTTDIKPDVTQNIGSAASSITQGNDFLSQGGGYYSTFTPDIKAILDKINNRQPFSYDPSADAAFQKYKAQAIDAGNKAYRNSVAGASMNGVATNSVAEQIAQNAQNENLKTIENAEKSFFERAYNQYLQEQNSDYKQLDALSNIDTTLYNRDRQMKSDYTDTISRFDKDYTAEINNIKGDGDSLNDWQIPYLEAARTQKLKTMADTKGKADNEAYQNAFEMWKMSGTATPQVAKILGVPVGAKTANYDIDSQNAATSRAKSTESSGGGGGGGVITKPETLNANYRDASSQFNAYSPNEAIRILKESKQNVIDQVGTDNYNKLLNETYGRNYESTVRVLSSQTVTQAYESLKNNVNGYVDRIGRTNYDNILAEYKKKYDEWNKVKEEKEKKEKEAKLKGK